MNGKKRGDVRVMPSRGKIKKRKREGAWTCCTRKKNSTAIKIARSPRKVSQEPQTEERREKGTVSNREVDLTLEAQTQTEGKENRLSSPSSCNPRRSDYA